MCVCKRACITTALSNSLSEWRQEKQGLSVKHWMQKFDYCSKSNSYVLQVWYLWKLLFSLVYKLQNFMGVHMLSWIWKFCLEIARLFFLVLDFVVCWGGLVVNIASKVSYIMVILENFHCVLLELQKKTMSSWFLYFGCILSWKKDEEHASHFSL